MKNRTLWILIVAAALAVFGSRWIARQRSAAGRPDARAGAPLLPFDINEIAAIRVRAGAQSLDLGRKEGRWLIASLYDYPADYDRLAGRLIELSELKIGQVLPGGAEDLAEFGLDEAGAPARVEFESADGRRLGRLTLGKTREGRGGPYGGFPDGQYARLDEGPVVLLGRMVSGFDGEARDWFKTDLLGVTAGAGASIEVETGGSSYRLRTGDGGRVELEGLGAEEKLDDAAARRVVNALQYLSFESVADPAKGDEELGFVAPDRYVLRTADGLIYTVLLGRATEGGGRPARIAVAYEPPPPPEPPPAAAPPPPEAAAEAGEGDASALPAAEAAKPAEPPETVAERNAKKAAEEHARVSRWTYVLSTWAAESLALPRAKLIAPPPPVPAEGDAAVVAPDAAPPPPSIE